MCPRWNGYGPAHGHKGARDAIAAKYSMPNFQLNAEDVFIASGCSDALLLIIHSVVAEGHNLLVPAPGFGLYTTVSQGFLF